MTTKKTNIIYKDLSYQIMGAIFEVHKELGPGLPLITQLNCYDTLRQVAIGWEYWLIFQGLKLNLGGSLLCEIGFHSRHSYYYHSSHSLIGFA
jgi:hypothetical protein